MHSRPDVIAHWLAANAITPLNSADAAHSSAAFPKLPDTVSQSITHLRQCPIFSLIVCDGNDDQALSRTLASLSNADMSGTQVVLAGHHWRTQNLARAADMSGGQAPIDLHIVDNVNSLAEIEASALNAARGTFVGFLAAGDQLEPNALALLEAIALHDTSANVIFTDEDWIDEDGRKSCPRLKSGWDPDAQLGRDHFGHLCLLRRSCVEEVGGLRLEHAPAHQYDLHCRVAFSVSPLTIRHVPLVLCHRAIPQADMDGSSADTFTRSARSVAQLAARQLCGESVTVTPAPLAPFINRIHWPVPEQLPLVSILVPTRDRADLVRNCVNGLLARTTYENFEVLILDNDSSEPETFQLFEQLSSDRRVRVVPAPGPFNFSRINNDGVKEASGEILVFMNNDIEIIGGGWLREMVSNALRPDVGCVGARLLYGDRHVQHAGIVLQPGPLAMHIFRRRHESEIGFDAQLAGTRSYVAVTAACLAVRRPLFERVGGFDEYGLQVSFQDVDLCLKIDELGFRNICTPFEPLLHLEGSSRSTVVTPEKHAREQRELWCLVHRWNDRFQDDSSGHPLIRLDWENPERMMPPPHDKTILNLVR